MGSKGSFSPARHGLVRAEHTEDEDGNWRDDQGRLIYTPQRPGYRGSSVHTHTDKDDSGRGMVGVSPSHTSFGDPTFDEVWSHLDRRHPSRIGVFQARLVRMGIHRSQRLR